MESYIGNVISALALLAAVAGFVWQSRVQISIVTERMSSFKDAMQSIERNIGVVEIDLKRLSEAMIQVARQDERLSAVDQRINGLNERLNAYAERLLIHAAPNPNNKTRKKV